ncbi:MAG: hypothetical protein EXR98_08110 [Gemmataceae bacterium]|nr:hypothetical protein [Gemmataceae bacterium]
MRFLKILSLAAFLALAAMLAADSGGPKDPPKIDVKKDDEKKPEPKIDSHDDTLLRRANIATDGPALVDFLKKRILPESERSEVEQMVRRLGHANYRTRELAMQELIARGISSVDVLRTYSLPPLVKGGSVASFDLELLRRIDRSILSIYERDVGAEVVGAVIRVAADKKSAGLVEALIGYLPFADNDALLDELRFALAKNTLKDGKANAALVSALTDRSALRRATAAEVLARAAYAGHKDAIRTALTDPDPLVRFRTARALAFAQQRDAIPTLIDTLADLPISIAWQAEDFLLNLAATSTAPTVSMGNDKETRAKCKDAWHAWWKAQGDKVDLAKLEETPRLLGRTLVVLLDQNTILELGADNQPRWEIKTVVFPLDAQLLGEDRVLVAEHHANRISERNLRGDVVWQKGVVAPLVAQRLANGNTFVSTDHQFLEFDKNGNETMQINLGGNGLGDRKILKAMKLPNDEIVCLRADARIVRYDKNGKELHSFPVNIGLRLYGGRIHMLPNGRVLVPQNQEGKVLEYDSQGKVIWETSIPSPIAATRLSNGNTLITSMDPNIGAVEVNRAGVHVWSYQHSSNTRVTRATRR